MQELKEKANKEFDEKWYSDFNHINAQREVCSIDCEESFELQEAEDWNKSLLNKYIDLAIEQNNKEWREKIDIIITAQEKRYEYNLKMYKKSNNELFDDNIEKNLEVINALEYLKDN